MLESNSTLSPVRYFQQELSILLIEDNLYDQQLFLEHLADTAFSLSKVITTEALSEAEILVSQNEIDLIIADVNVADASQSEAINRINRSFGNLPIILLTGSKDLEMARQAIRSGIQTYLIKDVQNPDTLNLAFTQALEQFKLQESVKFTINNLYQKSQLQNQITRSITHDYRSPVNNIVALLHLMEQDPESASMYREKAIEAGEQMLQYLEDNLAILRTPAGSNGKPERIVLRSCLHAVTRQIENELSAADLITDFSEVEEIKYSLVYLRSYFLNLLTNAIKYRHPERSPVIQIRSKKLKGYVVISFKDNGIGIDLEKYGSQIFGFKKRFHNGTAPGTGLGLFNLKNQVESLNGKVEVESEVGKGSTFTLYLPEF